MRNHDVNLLGHLVQDPASGLVGIADCKIILVNGNVRYSIQPLSQDTKELKPSWEIDEHRLIIQGQGQSASRIEVPPNVPIEAGFEVEDIATGMRGIAIERHESLNGCVSFVVVYKVKNERSPLQGTLPHERLKKIGKGISEKIKKAIEVANQSPTRVIQRNSDRRQHPGGPRTLSTSRTMSRR